MLSHRNNGWKGSPSVSQRLATLESQVFVQSSFLLAIAEVLESKNIATRGQIEEVVRRLSEARSRGFTQDEYQKFKGVVDKIVMPERPQ